MRLLIIDDDKDLLKLLKLTFEKEYEVDTAPLAKSVKPEVLGKYDLIILDVMMEEMSGFDFLAKYRSLVDPSSCLQQRILKRISLRGLPWAQMITLPSLFLWLKSEQG